jgi:hypothetical protein
MQSPWPGGPVTLTRMARHTIMAEAKRCPVTGSGAPVFVLVLLFFYAHCVQEVWKW